MAEQVCCRYYGGYGYYDYPFTTTLAIDITEIPYYHQWSLNGRESTLGGMSITHDKAIKIPVTKIK